MQDSKARRLALAARPRHQVEPEPADLVAYWRSQKWDKGSSDNHGRCMFGKGGRNLVIVRKCQALRCAPEQIRAATAEERQLIRAPHANLMTLKHAFETGQIASVSTLILCLKTTQLLLPNRMARQRRCLSNLNRRQSDH